MSAIAARRARLAAAASQSASSSPSPVPSQPIIDSVDGHDQIALAQKSVSSSDARATEGKRKPNVAFRAIDARAKRRKESEDDNELDVSHDPMTSSNDDATFSDAVHDARTETSALQLLSAQSTFVPRLRGVAKNIEMIQAEGANILKDNVPVHAVRCALRPDEVMCLMGAGTVSVVRGTITLGGATLTELHREAVVIATLNAPLPVLQAVGDQIDGAESQQWGFGTGPFAAIVELCLDLTSGVQHIHRICPSMGSNLFYSASSAHADWPLKGFGPTSSSSKNLLRSWVPDTWASALQHLEANLTKNQPLVALVRGPKRVGKSTLARLVLQKLLTSARAKDYVAFLETDMGQSEFGLPGTVSLHIFSSARRSTMHSSPIIFGPSWTSIRHPAKSHFLGQVSPKSCPALYIEALGDLLNVYRRQWQRDGIPLIVNTQGWVKGLGADLLIQLEEMVGPTALLDVSEDIIEDEISVPWDDQGITFTLEASPAALTRDRGLNAVEARWMNLTSYFFANQLPGATDTYYEQDDKDLQRESRDVPQWDFSQPVVTKKPFCVDVSTGVLGGIAILDDFCEVQDRYKLAALNGACVALVLQSHRVAEVENSLSSDEVWLRALQRARTSPSDSFCLGLAIVRSIDTDAARLHILTPLDASVIRRAMQSLKQTQGSEEGCGTHLAIVKGSLDLPVWLSLDLPLLEALRTNNVSKSDPTHLAGVRLRSVPYLDFNSNVDEHAVGMGKRRIRRNLLRQSQRGHAA